MTVNHGCLIVMLNSDWLLVVSWCLSMMDTDGCQWWFILAFNGRFRKRSLYMGKPGNLVRSDARYPQDCHLQDPARWFSSASPAVWGSRFSKGSPLLPFSSGRFVRLLLWAPGHRTSRQQRQATGAAGQLDQFQQRGKVIFGWVRQGWNRMIMFVYRLNWEKSLVTGVDHISKLIIRIFECGCFVQTWLGENPTGANVVDR